MTIEIGKEIIQPPVIRISGSKVSSTDGAIAESSEDIYNSQHVVENELEFTQRETVLYDDEVTVTIVPDSSYETYTYKDIDAYEDFSKSTNKVIGKVRKNVNNVGQNSISETYYSLNGKDPLRTKTFLYTKPFVVRRNSSGSDDVILKAKTFVGGKSSLIRTVKIRIVDKQIRQSV